jgi:hypothetical protein
MTIIVPRPTVTIVSSPSGKNFTVNAQTELHDFEYQLLPKYFIVNHGMEGYPQTEAEAREVANSYLAAFEEEATAIESGAKRPYHINGNLKDHGMAKSRRKLSSAFKATS